MPDVPYTHGHHDSVLRSHRWRTAENSAAYLLPHLRPGLDLLDVGCGPGTITVDLAGRVAPGTVVGLDAAAEVIAEATARVDPESTPNVTFRVGDVFALPFEDGSFDVVHAHQVLQHVGDPVAALSEMRRVCRPGGLVAARDGDYPAISQYPADPVLDAAQAAYRAAATRQRGSHRRRPPAAGLGPPGRLRHGGALRLGVVLRHAGGAPVVGRPVGRPVHRLLAGRAAGGPRPGHPGRSRVLRGGLATVGRRPRRLVRHPARGGALHPVRRVTPPQPRAASTAARNRSGASTIG